MADELYVKVGSTIEPVALEADTAPEYVERIEAVEEAVPALDSSLRALIAQEVAKCLKLSGGDLVGQIAFAMDASTCITRKTDDKTLIISGGNAWNKGAVISLNGGSNQSSPSLFEVRSYRSDGQYSAFRLTPDALTWNGNNVLTSAGGTLTGAIYADNTAIRGLYANGRLGFASSDGKCAALNLFGRYLEGAYAGAAELIAENDSSRSTFVLFPNGTSKINGSPVLTLVASWSDGKGNWYRKYSDGFIEQGGAVIFPLGQSPKVNVNLHIPFATSNYNVSGSFASDITRGTSSDSGLYALNRTTTAFQLSAGYTFAESTVYWFACGY